MSSEAPGSPGVGSQLAGADVSGGFCSGSPFQSPVPPLCPWSSQHLRQSFSLWTVTPAAWGLERPQEQGGWSTVGTGRPDDAWVLSAGWGWRGCPPALALEACLGTQRSGPWRPGPPVCLHGCTRGQTSSVLSATLQPAARLLARIQNSAEACFCDPVPPLPVPPESLLLCALSAALRLPWLCSWKAALGAALTRVLSLADGRWCDVAHLTLQHGAEQSLKG